MWESGYVPIPTHFPVQCWRSDPAGHIPSSFAFLGHLGSILFIQNFHGNQGWPGTWVKSSFVVRSRPFVVSTMGSVTAQHCNVSCYASYHNLYLHTFVVSTVGSATAQHYNVSYML